MKKLEADFLDAYKQLSQDCAEIFGGSDGVSQYLSLMDQTDADEWQDVESWEADYRTLIRLRHVRNEIARKVGESSCTPEDRRRLYEFSDRLTRRQDALSVYRRPPQRQSAPSSDRAPSEPDARPSDRPPSKPDAPSYEWSPPEQEVPSSDYRKGPQEPEPEEEAKSGRGGKALRVAAIIVAILALLCGVCFAVLQIPAVKEITTLLKVKTVGDCSLQYNAAAQNYNLLFGLQDKNGEYLTAGVLVDIRISDETRRVLYYETRQVSAEDFKEYGERPYGLKTLASVQIPASEISRGSTKNGTVVINVYRNDVFQFGETQFAASNCLPVKNATLSVEEVPVVVECKNRYGEVDCALYVENVSYVYEEAGSPAFRITVSGGKVYQNPDSSYSDPYDSFAYELYDSAGNLADSGTVYMQAVRKGEMFEDNSLVLSNVTPGESYLLRLTAANP